MSKIFCTFARSYHSTGLLVETYTALLPNIYEATTPLAGTDVLGSGVVACKCGLIER